LHVFHDEGKGKKPGELLIGPFSSPEDGLIFDEAMAFSRELRETAPPQRLATIHAALFIPAALLNHGKTSRHLPRSEKGGRLP
jgi:hypothetical protein